MGSLITVNMYPDIRAALDVSLGEAELPNSIIAQRIYAGAARDEVLGRYPTAESETDSDIVERLKRAAIYLTAARLCPAVVRITSLTITKSDINYSKQTFDPEKRAAELRALAEQELAEVIEPSADTPQRPTFFSLATGRRGQ